MTLTQIRKTLKTAGLWQYENGGTGKCGIGRTFGDFQVKEEGKKVWYGPRNRRSRLEKTGRVVVVPTSNKLDKIEAALTAAGISFKKETLSERKVTSVNYDAYEYFVITQN